MLKVQGLVCGIVVTAAAVTMLAMAGSASAATLRSTATGVRYDAAPGEANDITATVVGKVLSLRDNGATVLNTSSLPAGCTDASGIDATGAAEVGADCNLPGDVTLTVNMGDGDDWFDGTYLPKRVSLNVDTGQGDNVVEGGAGDDLLVGHDGNDTMYGDQGDDTLRGGNGQNWLRAGGGDDVVTAGDGFDFVFGDGGNDVLNGGGEDDYVYGGAGNDVVNGGPGNDLVDGQGGDDTVSGGAGDDEVRGGKGSDILDGGVGNDLIRARDGIADIIACGAGTDVARVDAGEVDFALKSCETVKQADTTPTEPADSDTLATGTGPAAGGTAIGQASVVAGGSL